MSDSLYGGGIFGSSFGDDEAAAQPDAASAQQGTTALAPVTQQAAVVAAQPAAAAQAPAATPVAPVVDPQLDAAFFVRDQTGVSYLRPEMAAAANGIIEQLAAAVLPPNQIPGNLPANQFRAYMLAPAAAVAGVPAYVPLRKAVQAEQGAGNTLFLLPKQIMSATAPTSQVVMVVSTEAVGLPLAMHSADLFRYLPTEHKKSGGMSVTTTALIGLSVLAGGYAITRLVQKKPLLPSMK